jgi:hypothetical protein
VAGLALNLCNVIGVRVLLDVGVAVVALQAAVDTGAKHLSIHGNAVPSCILHCLVAVTCQAIRLCQKGHGGGNQQKCYTQAQYARSKMRVELSTMPSSNCLHPQYFWQFAS